MALSPDRQLRHPALQEELPSSAEITFPAREAATADAIVDDLAGVPASEIDETQGQPPAAAPPPAAVPTPEKPLKEVSSSAPTDTALLERAIRAEADATYAREYAKRLEEQLRRPVPGMAAQAPAPPPDPMGDPFRKELGEAGVDPEKLDAYVLARQESVFRAIRERLELQKDERERTALKIRAEEPGFDERLVEAKMAQADPSTQRLYALGLEQDRENALRFGWGMVKSGGQPAASAVTPPAGNPRATMPASQQRVSTAAPGAGTSWATMNEKQRADLVRALGEAADGSDEEKRLLRLRFGGTSVDRVYDISGGAARSWE